MEKKIGYCPMCDKKIFNTTKASMIHCPNCNHHISLSSWISPCKCGALPQICEEGPANKNMETNEEKFTEQILID